MKNGDVVVKYNNQPVENANQLKLRVAETAPGTTVPIDVERSGEVKTLQVTIKERANNNAASNTPSTGTNRGESLAGVTVTNLDNENRAEMKIPNSVQGALITDVDQNSPAYDAGLRTGDVITEINHHPVRSSEDAVNLTEKPSGGQTLVKVWSHGGSRYIAVNEGGGES